MARKRQEKKKKKGRERRNRSKLKSHRREGKVLTPPFLTLGNVGFSSWCNERLPEMLWAALLVVHLDRHQTLEIFRRVCDIGAKHLRDLEDRESKYDVTFSGLAALPIETSAEIVDAICGSPEARSVLRALLILDDLPGRGLWVERLDGEEVGLSWDRLLAAVALTFNQQSEESTDCRWLRCLFKAACGRVVFTKELADQAREIVEYPNFGDMNKVRPSIRAFEMGLSGDQVNSLSQEWCDSFWGQALNDTPCIEMAAGSAALKISLGGCTRPDVIAVFDALVGHAHTTRATSALDPKHDGVFGLALFACNILTELMVSGIAGSAIGRQGLRSLLEVFVTLAYLIHHDEDKLWRSYRAYGSGQGKLALLKLESSDRDDPEFVSMAFLEELANEDAWEEFVKINLGHWDKTTLRRMAKVAGVEDTYDSIYLWSSGYVHGHWGAVRNSVFQTCVNPLHRLHRIPLTAARLLPDVVPDAVLLLNKILVLVDETYPAFPHRLGVAETD